MSITSNIVYFPTVLGDMWGASFNDKIIGLHFADSITPDKAIKNLKTQTVELKNDLLLQNLQSQIVQYFSGDITAFNLSCSIVSLTQFQEKVLKVVKEIPYGHTWTYEQLSLRLGNVKAIRAVAHANASNPLLLLYPCHRVIGSNGSLTGYAGGLKRKKKLLELEGAIPKQESLFLD